MMKRQPDGVAWVVLLNSSAWNGPEISTDINYMMARALSQVKKWPDNDLFRLFSAGTFVRRLQQIVKNMCFSVNVNLVKEELENRYGATFLDPDKYSPSYYYHAFGLPVVPAICSGKTDQIQLLKWGLIPSWVKTSESAEEIRFKTFNARAESIDSKPSFSGSFSAKRCIIPVKGFFEWQQTGGIKIPWYISRADEDIMSLAGLWSEMG